MAKRIVYRRSFWDYILEGIMSPKKSEREEDDFCDKCGKKGVFARCSRCKKQLCKSCSYKRGSKYYCERHR